MEFVQPIRDKKQIDAMKKILKATSVRDFCLFTLAINCGLRIRDLLNLLINDVIDEKGKVRERIAIREQKTGKTKDFPIYEIAAKAIKEYLVDRRSYNQQEPLFLSRKSSKGLASLQGGKHIPSSMQRRDQWGSKTRSGHIRLERRLVIMPFNKVWTLRLYRNCLIIHRLVSL